MRTMLVLSLMLILFFSVDAYGRTNIAFGKTVSLSSVYNLGTAGYYAVDGTKTGLWEDGCASTGQQKNPWMLIDLGEDYRISSAFIMNRIDCCLDRLFGLHIAIGHSSENLTEVLYVEDPLGNETTLTFDKAHCGRFVKLWRKEGFLTICEIEIYSENTAGNWTNWSEWSSCTDGMGNGQGVSTRSRSCKVSEYCGSQTETVPCSNQNCPETCSCTPEPRDCQDWKDEGYNDSGVYRVTPVGSHTGFDVYCDMETDKGAWLVFQRRTDDTVDFYKNWTDYLNGFEPPDGNHWLGLQRMNMLISQGHYELRIDLEDWEGETRYAKYTVLHLGDARKKFELTVDGYTGNAGDALSAHSSLPFSTKDKDQTDRKCASLYEGGWWYNDCHSANLNGRYFQGGAYNDSFVGKGINWYQWKGHLYSLKKTEMKIRRV